MPVIYMNGKFEPEERAHVSPFNRGLLYGDGLFETMRGYQGKPFAIKEHFERIRKSADFLRIDIPFDLNDLEDIFIRLLELNSLTGCDSRLRLNLIRGIGKGGLLPDPEAAAEVIITAEEVTGDIEKIQKDGIKLITISNFRIDPISPLAQHKTFNYISGVLGLMEVKEKDGDEGVFLNNEGNLVEGVTSNIFIVKNKSIATPPLSAGILPGITRGLVLKVAASEGVDVKERDISIEEFYDADEVFISSSVREVVPVISADERVFEIGPIARRLQESYKRYVEGNV